MSALTAFPQLVRFPITPSVVKVSTAAKTSGRDGLSRRHQHNPTVCRSSAPRLYARPKGDEDSFQTGKQTLRGQAESTRGVGCRHAPAGRERLWVFGAIRR